MGVFLSSPIPVVFKNQSFQERFVFLQTIFEMNKSKNIHVESSLSIREAVNRSLVFAITGLCISQTTSSTFSIRIFQQCVMKIIRFHGCP